MSIKSKLKGKDGTLAKNTGMLFLLTISNYVFNFITIPYQTRVLEPSVFGNISFAMSVMSYFQLLTDFGFLLSATEDIAKEREDSHKVSRIFTAVMWCKLFLVALSFIIMAVLCFKVKRFNQDIPLFFLYWISYSIYAFLPDFLYRGIEKMQAITIRSVLIKAFTTCLIFVLLKKPSQYYIIPILTGIGNLGAVVFTYIHVRKMGYGFVRVKFQEITNAFKRSSFFFFSRIASSVFTATNTLILGFKFGESSALVGHYSSAEKAITIAKQTITPVSDSLYPYMIKNRNFKMIKKLLLIGMPVFFVGCSFVMLTANDLCAIVFGKDYYAAGTYLRLLAPVVFFAYPGMILGFPTLTPMGLAKHANISTILGAVLQITMFVTIHFTIGISAEAICIATCITEIFMCAYRAGIVIKNRHLLSSPDQTTSA
ncbi:MAG: hypothetical protein E7387_06800 [Ruminococcaceae bacterium]|nr:hypothetical protein [Oscillospiraceae bacterium]